MAVSKMIYPGLNESLKYLRVQIIDSLPYCQKHFKVDTVRKAWDVCKSKFKYKNDPHTIEFFQTVPTLLTDNKYFNSGEGDCDDATIFILSVLLANGFEDCGIILAGRNKYNARHIYAYCYNDGKKYILDLTQPAFNSERFYPFTQQIPFKLSKSEKMFLQLADNNEPQLAARYKKPKLRIKRLTQEQKDANAIFLPSKNLYVPFEKMDKMPLNTVKQTMLSEGYEIDQLSEYLSGRAERKAKRAMKAETKKAKQEIKLEKKRAKVEKTKAKTEVKKAKADKKRSAGEAKKMRAQAKIIKSQAKETAAQKGTAPAYSEIFKTAGNVVNRIISRDEQSPDAEETDAEVIEQEDYTPAIYDEQETDQEQESAQEETEQESQELESNNTLTSDLFLTGLFIGGVFAERKNLFK